jgi:hypothetical protein
MHYLLTMHYLIEDGQELIKNTVAGAAMLGYAVLLIGVYVAGKIIRNFQEGPRGRQ